MTQNARAPRKARRNLVSAVVSGLKTRIENGEFKPGERLPSEAQLTDAYSVSRTVVREAISGLRADGLVEPRQGAGVFVLEPVQPTPKPFQIDDFEKISAIIEMLELRVAVEMEAAALAAVRRSPTQEEAILDAEAKLRGLAADGQPTTQADLEFHLAIADATNNPRFREFLEIMGEAMIPRSMLARGSDNRSPADYIAHIAHEHRQIAEAIGQGEPEEARAAMRQHLQGSQRRYRKLIRDSL